MNQFQYSLAIKKIDTFTTLKAKEAAIREWYKEAQGTNSYGLYYNHSKTAGPDIPFLYKCITKTLMTFSILRLPEGIRDGIMSMQNGLVHQLTDEETTYDKFIDTFQYIDMLEYDNLTAKELSNLAVIYQDNPLTFAIEHCLSVSSKFEYLLDEWDDTLVQFKNMSEVLEVEHIKHLLPRGVRYTILEDVLDKYYNTVIENTPEYNDSAVQQMEDLVTITRTMQTRLSTKA